MNRCLRSLRARNGSGPASVLAGLLMLLAMPAAWAASDNSISFGVPPWPGERVKAEVASQILETIGYEASATDAGWAIVLQGVANGDIDADMAIWKPTQNSVVDPMLKKGEVEMVVANIKDAKYAIVVPQYVCDAGVTSIADLNKQADKFDSKIYGIEAGNDGNEIVKTAIEKGTYNLSGWTLVPSSTAGMLAQAQRAVNGEDWIAFLGWKPHWMNVVMDLCYLDDPKKIWGGESTVHTVANPEFLKNHPNLAKFLGNMVIPAKVQSQWIYDYGYEKIAKEEVASRWIRNHPDMVAQWLEGVKTADGRDAAEVFRNSLKGDGDA